MAKKESQNGVMLVEVVLYYLPSLFAALFALLFAAVV